MKVRSSDQVQKNVCMTNFKIEIPDIFRSNTLTSRDPWVLTIKQAFLKKPH